MEQSNKFGLEVARAIINSKDSEWPDVIQQLRRERQLSNAIHEINNLQRDPIHTELASAAIKKIGFH